MYYKRNLLLSIPLTLLLLLLFYFAFSSPTTIYVQNSQQPLSGTQKGLPLPFQYEYNCPYAQPSNYCSTPTPPLNVTTLSNPSGYNYANIGIDLLFWFAISLAIVMTLDALTSKRFARQEQEAERTIMRAKAQ